MSKKYLGVLICVFYISICFSQDAIIKTNLDSIKCKIYGVDSTHVSYHPTIFEDTAIYRISKAEVYLLRYKDGSTDTINKVEISQPTAFIRADDVYSNGQKIDYAPFRSQGAVTLVTTSVASLFGLIPAMIYTQPPLKPNSSYGYADDEHTREVYEIKKKYIWKRFGIGIGINVGLILLIAVSE